MPNRRHGAGIQRRRCEKHGRGTVRVIPYIVLASCLLVCSVPLAAARPAAQGGPVADSAGAAAAAYRIAREADEIALARSAAPASVSANAEILTLGRHGYRTAVKGRNGFVCLVERSWANEFGDPEFWNPRLRAPICYNGPAARSVLPEYLQRTQWLMAGMSLSDVRARTRAQIANGKIGAPEAGAMAYMTSKLGYLGDRAHGPWRPHLMFFMPRMNSDVWGAGGSDAIVLEGAPGIEPATVLLVPLPKWSDGTVAAAQR